MHSKSVFLVDNDIFPFSFKMLPLAKFETLSKQAILKIYEQVVQENQLIELLSKKIDFDLIIASGYPYDHILPAFFASKKWNVPLILIPFIHGEFPELHLTGFRLNILKNSNVITVLSDSEKKLRVPGVGLHNHRRLF